MYRGCTSHPSRVGSSLHCDLASQQARGDKLDMACMVATPLQEGTPFELLWGETATGVPAPAMSARRRYNPGHDAIFILAYRLV